MNRSSLAAAAAIAATLITLSACEGETVCDYIEPTPPTGDFLTDLQGCWQAPGLYTLGQDPYREVVYQFTGREVQEGSGVYTWREIQSPNSLYAGGNVFQYAYARIPDAGTLLLYEGAEGYVGSDGGVPDGTVERVLSGLDLGGVVSTISWDFGVPPATAVVTPTSLLLDYYFQDTRTSVFGFAQPFRRAVCRGFGFEDKANACPTSAPTR